MISNNIVNAYKKGSERLLTMPLEVIGAHDKRNTLSHFRGIRCS